MKKERILNYDLIRCIALFLLVSLHFFLNTGFYNTTLIGKKMYLAASLRTISMLCIPLFLLLTGALMHKKELNKKYYHGLKKILLIYVITMVINYTFYHYFLGQKLTLKIMIINILMFKDSAWYINMYIGLFLLIPFFNRLYDNLEKKEKKYLIITLITLTSLPTVFNIYDLSIARAFFKNPSISKNYTQLIPNWYIGFYPLTYYFLGAYLSDLKLNVKKIKLLVLWFSVVMISSIFNIYRYHNSNFMFENFTSWPGIENVISSSILFLLLKQIYLDNKPKIIINMIKKISDLEYAAYLVLPLVETVIYFYFNKKVLGFNNRIIYYPVITSLIFIGSLLLSYVITNLYHLLISINTKKSKILLLLIIFVIIISKIFLLLYPHWSKYSINDPILGDEESGSLFDPHVIYDDKKYKMFVSKRNIGSIVVYESNDGIKWSDNYKIVLKPNKNSGWENIVNRASVIRYHNNYYLYYTGQYGNEKIENSEIGLAISSDGYNFKRYSNKPIISIKGKNIQSVMNPFVLYDKEDKLFKMYYAAGETYEPDMICYATSIDGVNWNDYKNNPILEKNSDKRAFDMYKVGAVDVKKVSHNLYKMYYIGYNSISSSKIFSATSTDGIKWQRDSYKSIVAPSKEGWDRDAVYKPSLVFNKKKNKYYLYYNGRNGSSEYIGLSILNNDTLE